MKKLPEIPIEDARNFYLQKQLLDGAKLPGGKAGAFHVINTLGYLQIDTINVVKRSHHIVLFTRCPDYKEVYLETLQAKERKIFEYWAHEASYVPVSDYCYYLSAIKKKPKPGSWLARWIKEHRELLKKVKKRITDEGPLTASDFVNTRRNKGTWWSWKAEKMALEVLFWRGELMIKERRNFKRVYDLAARVLTQSLSIKQPGKIEEKEFFIKRALGAMGFATIQDINRYIRTSGKLDPFLDAMVRQGRVKETAVFGRDKIYLILPGDLEKIGRSKPESAEKVRFLSPFDNAVIQRERVKDLFNFDYKLECYVTKDNRKYGYFCMPILWRNKFVGRIDPKADRLKNTLIIQNINFEKDTEIGSAAFVTAFAESLANFARFNDCCRINFACRQYPGFVNRISRNF